MQGGYTHEAYEAPHQELGYMKRHFDVEDHMLSDGVSAPVPAANHGYGRKHMIPVDHQVTREDGDVDNVTGGEGRKGRKLIIPYDHLKSDVMRPVSDIDPVRVPTTDDMKSAVKDWLITVHSMFVFNETKWDTEVSLEPNGCHWVIEALTQQKRSISREGPSARVIAEKMSMMPPADLHHFGIRFAERNDPQPPRREKRGTFEDNRSLVSPGVQDALSRDSELQHGIPQTLMSSNRKHPEDIQRRYISSGQDHWKQTVITGGDLPGSHGHAKDDDFSDGGLERGMGHGKRFIGSKDHLIGGGTLADR